MNTFNSRSTLKVGNSDYIIYRLSALEKAGFRNVNRLPFSIRVLLENLLRREDGKSVSREDIEALARWNPQKKSDREIAFTPARVILQDFTGVPAMVDLAAMRDAIRQMGGDPQRINPLEPADLVIDHSVQVDAFGTPGALEINESKEYDRNLERYQFLRWGAQAFRNFRVVPPGMGIIHQVNLEYLAKVVITKKAKDMVVAYPDTVVGTDSHTTMINGLGVLGWGVGGIEAEAAMLGQPISMLIPEVVGVKLKGKLKREATATDAVLTVTEMLRKKGVVGKFVEFFGPGLDHLSLADRATLANMAPEYGATMGFFPVDEETINYLRLTGRDDEIVELTENYLREQELFRTSNTQDPTFSDTLVLDLGTVEVSIAGPRRPQDRFPLSKVKRSFRETIVGMVKAKGEGKSATISQDWFDEGSDEEHKEEKVGSWTQTVTTTESGQFRIGHGAVVIAAITSCTNTSNPAVMIGAALLARKAVERGLMVKPWVKTSLAPGSQVVVDYLQANGLLSFLEKLKFHVVGFGCMTCIGNSGPLSEPVSTAVQEGDLVVASVVSANRNFEGRINPLVRANYLASPLLVVAYAIAGRIDIDFEKDPLGMDSQGRNVYLRDLWPTSDEIQGCVKTIRPEMFRERYERVFDGDSKWKSVEIPSGDTFAWDEKSTYVKNPPYFENLPKEPKPLSDITGARVLVMAGDSVTTDHISPAGAISEKSPAGQYLIAQGVGIDEFNSYGSRRGNHEVMMRGTFANIRLRNLLAPGTEGGLTRHLPDGEVMNVYDAAMKYRDGGISMIVLAGKEYGSGSSRDWAAKGPALLGIKAVIAESFERIHRSNLIGMGILPLQFIKGTNRESLGITGEEVYCIAGIGKDLVPGKKLICQAKSSSGVKEFEVLSRIDTPVELAYYQDGGILPYVCRQLLQ